MHRPELDTPMTYEEFLALFPDDDACLEYLKTRVYPDGTVCPRCSRPSKFHRITDRTAYSCQYCGGHVYPTAGTIFHRSRTGLQRWFWAVLLISSTRGGISARQLERELGVTYKTAQRMLTRVRPAVVAEEMPASPSAAPVWQGARRRA